MLMLFNPILLEVLTFGLTLWLGLYLLARSHAGHGLFLTGIGLCSYALALASGTLLTLTAGDGPAVLLVRLQWIFLSLPAFFWAGAILRMSEIEGSIQPRLRRGLNTLLLVAALSAILLLSFASVQYGSRRGSISAAYPLFAAVVIVPLLVGLWSIRYVFSAFRSRKPYLLLVLAGLLFTTVIVVLVLPLDWLPINWLPSSWLVLAGSFDLLLLGLSIAVLDSYEEGEAVLPDMSRSLGMAALASLVFGGQVVLLMYLVTGLTAGTLSLLLGTLAAAILWQTFSDPIQALLDRFAFRSQPEMVSERAAMRAESRILTRMDVHVDPAAVDEEEFARLTRRALSHYNDLPRLASSPLTRLPIIEARLLERGAGGETLEGAAELKAILAESINKLKPRQKGAFGTSDEWRFYNALYFPYVVGLRPYSRREQLETLDEADREAFEWFRTFVPERTLYNWQNAAARLVAQDLRERSNWQ